ncbi:Fum1p [Penicillium frequentans]|nr:Fum1p [Penicillium glabrum]
MSFPPDPLAANEILHRGNQQFGSEHSKQSAFLESRVPTLTINQTSFCKEPGTKGYAFDLPEAGARWHSNPSEPIAIVGMGLRLPGGVSSPDEFWKFLIEKRDGLCEVPETRYKLDSFYSDSKPHSVKTRKGYFLKEDPALFDAEFFSINKFEAERMDPQQRQLMEVVWECLESAGETNWRGKEIGCFIGVYGEDWLELASKDFQNTDRYHVLGTGQFALSNRVSYEYDFQGPSMTLQTGCSSSLVGLHEACQAIYSGECTSAIVGGTNLIFSPTMTTTMSDNMVLSPSGICRTFDGKADGYGRGEAINAIYIKPLKDAIREKDPVRAVIRATSTNCDGHTPSITTPGSISQERLIRKAYKKAKLDDITQTAFFECHGTGTTVGDTAETSVVAKVFGEKGTIIGSVKPNVGHSEGASGVTSIIKAALALENNQIPPNIFFDTPNPSIPWEKANLQVPTSTMAWPKDRSERISVNCFGIGGANAHVVMESMAAYCGQGPNTQELTQSLGNESRLLPVSAMSQESLQQRIQDIIDYANNYPALLPDLAYTLGKRREHMKHRAFAVVHPGKPIDQCAFMTSQVMSADLVFVFTGQGAQWPGMGKDLMDTFESFRKDIQSMDLALQKLESPPNWSLQDELAKMGGESRVNQAAYSQPLCTAIQVGIVNLLRKMGIRPVSVVGHSSGEIAAAYAAGAITATSAVIIAYYRGKAIQSQDGKGAMVAVGLGRQAILPYLEEGAVLACENSPENITLSGDIEVIRDITAKIKKDFPDILCRPLRVNTAYHSHHMLEVGNSYQLSIANHLEFQETMLPLFSSVTSAKITNPCDLDATYWRQNLQAPVLFLDAITATFKNTEDAQLFLEIGPHSTLAGPLRQIFKSVAHKKDPIYIPTMTRYVEDSRSQLLHTLGCIHMNGGNINFSAANGDGMVLTHLPTYPWLHKSRHWHESRLAREWRQQQSPHHEILGARVAESSDLEPSWRNILRLENVPWIWDHVLQGNVMFPAAGYISMAGEAIRQLNPDAGDYSIKQFVLKSPLLMEDDQAVEIFTTLRREKYNDMTESEWYVFTITAYDGKAWTKHCQGQVRSGYDHPPITSEIKSNIRPVNSDQWYRYLSKYGVSYGPTFRGLTKIFAHPAEYQANATVFDPKDHASRYTMHPIVIDQTLQLLSVASANGIARRIDRFAIPAAIGQIYIGGNAPEMQIESRMAQNETGIITGSSYVVANGIHLLSINQATFFTVQDRPVNNTSVPLISEIRWIPDIDFTSPSSWVTPPVISQKEREFRQDVLPASFLYILETASRIASCTPKEPHMVIYKNWINTEASKILSGTYKNLHGGFACIEMSSNDRVAALHDKVMKYENDAVRSGGASALQTVFENCVELVSGAKSSLDILMEDESLRKYYECINAAPLWFEFLQALGNTNPSLRVLEVGAGTGTATRNALDDLKSPEGVCLYSKYVFTDVSAAFTIAAQKEFAAYENLEFKILDISRDVEDQGFEPHSFDLVIASNVFHATPSLKTTLQNVHTLLSPTGKLLLFEMCPEYKLTDYVMGTLPGWWIGKDDQRAERPYVSPERWDCELQAAGFTGCEALAHDFEQPFQHNFTMISGISVDAAREGRQVFIVYNGDSSSWASEVASKMSKNGHVVNWGTLEESPPADRNQDLIFLLDIHEPFLYNLREEAFIRFQNYILNVENNRIIWVTHSSQIRCDDPRYGLTLGFSRNLRRELGIDISIFETDAFDTTAASSLCLVYEKINKSREMKGMSPEYEFSHCLGSTMEKGLRKLEIKSTGLLDTMHWIQCPEERLEKDLIEIDMKKIGVNFRDLMVAMGLVGHKDQIGIEGSGLVRRVGSDVKDFSPGDRVIVCCKGVFKTRITIDPEHCWKIPDGISLADAASMPTVYVTAIYSLIELGNLQKDQTVLIHSACGGVGLASIQVCKDIGAEIFATVGSEEKVQYLMENFGIPRSHIFNSRNNTFLPDLLRATNGRGADIVLNSLAGELLHASWECVASRGKMIELGKRDFLTNGTLSMAPFLRNRAFYGVDVLSLTEESPQYVTKLLLHATELCEQGRVKPIRPLMTFPANKVIDAFRYMQQGVHMGKIVIEIPDDISELEVSNSAPAASFSPLVSYLLVGGLGGLGRTISTWMVENGARYLMFLSRSAGQSENDQAYIRELEAQSCHVQTVAGDVTKLSDVQNAVSKCIKPLAGVFQLSVKLTDRTFEKMKFEDWTSALAPKVNGTWNLHRAVEKENLDFFVVFGSVVGVVGNNGQINYAAANTFLDSFTQYRRNLGLASSAIALGPVEDVGIVSRNPELLHAVRVVGSYLLDEGDVIKGLEAAINRSAVKQTVQNASVIVGLTPSKSSADSTICPNWETEARYSLHRNIESTQDVGTELKSDNLRALVAKVEENPEILDDPETELIISREIGKLITQHMANAEDMNDEQIAQVAIDSLMSIEIRGWIRRNLGLEISLAEISKAGTVGSLATLAVENLRAKYRKP